MRNILGKKAFLLIKARVPRGMVLSPVKTRHLFLWFLTAAMLAFAYGCGGDADIEVVDFSETISVEQPRDKLHNNGTLRVAVAAMISPKETFGYNRQILDYIGKHLGQNIELIQRKTYDKVNQPRLFVSQLN